MSIELETLEPDSGVISLDVAAPSAELAGQRVEQPVPSRYFDWKRGGDLVIGGLLLIPAVPIMVVLMVIVKLTSRGPAIFRQARVGQDGENFVMYKIRSMTNAAEAKSGPVWSSGAGDARVTRVGRILRFLHLDELPQLFNVLKGEMSLIGPRPERPEFVYVLKEKIDGYSDRHLVRPGITGLAQINLPPDTDLESVRRKQQLDIEYIETATAWMDFRMFLCTLLRLVGMRNEFAARTLGLRRHIPDCGHNERAMTPDALQTANGHIAPAKSRPK